MSSASFIDIVQFKPDSSLKKYIRKISVFKSKNILQFNQILTPTAYIYLTYHHEDIPANVIGNNKIKPTFRLQIDGPKIDKEVIVEYNGKLNRILVEFTATGFYYLFHESPSKYIDSLLRLNEFFPPKSIELLEIELQSLDDSKDQIKVLEKFLIELSYKASPFCDYVEEALQVIDSNHGSIPIGDIIKKISVSERQFSRQFSKIVGISPKHYSKIVQLHYIINLMNLKNYSSLQDIAFSAEFYDLSHFTRVFKKLTGYSPVEFLKSDKHIALKYFTDLI